MRSTTGAIPGKVDIIIPVWGKYDVYLNECLESVQAQTYKNYNVVIVDEYTDLPTARNRGIEKSNGEWVLILDVDNKLAPDYLEKTVGKGDIVSTYLQYFGDSNGIYNTPEATVESMQGGNQVDANALYKKDVWNEVGGYDETMKYGWEDYDFWYRCLKAGYRINVVKQPLMFYRKHGKTMSVTAGLKSEQLRNYILNKQHGV